MSFVKLIQESCHLGDEIRHRLYDRVFSDMVVRTGDGRDHRVHRLVLAAASPFVRGLLLQASEEELPVVVLPDFTSESFTSLLPCLYGGFRESDRQPDPEIARLLRVGPWAPAHDKPLSPRSSVQPAENHHENSGERPVRLKRGRRRKTTSEADDEAFGGSTEAVNEESFETRSDVVSVHGVDGQPRVDRARRRRRFCCKLCPKSFDYEKQLTKHSKSHSAPTKADFRCSKCDRVFNNKSSLHYHVKKHQTPTHPCSACPRTFKSVRGLRYHMNLHNGVTDFLCHDCGKGFITRQKLINHRRSKHTFEKPYICDQCGQGFVRSDKLVVHRRRAHTGEKPYQCDACDWRGVDSSSLIHHRKKHANERSSHGDAKDRGPML